MQSGAPKHLAGETYGDYADSPKTPMLNNKTYDFLKFIAMLFLPALGTLYFTLAQIWGLPHAEDVVGSITAVDVFLGLLLGLSSSSYKNSDTRFDGEINVSENRDGVKQAALVLKNYENPADVVQQKEVVFKVNPS